MNYNKFKLRAECANDVISFYTKVQDIVKEITIVRPYKPFPDVEATIFVDLTLPQIRDLILEYVKDGHVMAETVQNIDEYDGQRTPF